MTKTRVKIRLLMQPSVFRCRHSGFQSTPSTPVCVVTASHLPHLFLATNSITGPARAYIPWRKDGDGFNKLWAWGCARRKESDACPCAAVDSLRKQPCKLGCRWTCDDKDYEGTKAPRYALVWRLWQSLEQDCANNIFVETRDGKKSYDGPPHSKEMTRMNNAFARMHGASSLLNLLGLLATMWYGFTLAERLQ